MSLSECSAASRLASSSSEQGNWGTGQGEDLPWTWDTGADLGLLGTGLPWAGVQDRWLTSSFLPCTHTLNAAIPFLSNLRKEQWSTKAGCANALLHLQKKTKAVAKLFFYCNFNKGTARSYQLGFSRTGFLMAPRIKPRGTWKFPKPCW